MEQKLDEATKEFQVIKTVLLASMQGYAPQVAVESAPIWLLIHSAL